MLPWPFLHHFATIEIFYNVRTRGAVIICFTQEVPYHPFTVWFKLHVLFLAVAFLTFTTAAEPC